MSAHGRIAMVIGERPPALSVSWHQPESRFDSGFIIFMADCALDDPGFDEMGRFPTCLHCLTEHGDEQLGRGLDLAKLYGHVDWDSELEEWFIPDDRCEPGRLGWDTTF